jgi:hypothetical protein
MRAVLTASPFLVLAALALLRALIRLAVLAVVVGGAVTIAVVTTHPAWRDLLP